ncbi:MAG: transglutaminase-like domain-containing protein [Bacteroidales bacterium]
MKSFQTLLLLTLVFIFSGCSSFFRLINYIPSARIVDVNYTNDVNNDYRFFFPDTVNNPYLKKLRLDYGLDTLTKNVNTQLDKVKIILDWTNRQWIHSGGNEPTKSDPISILEEARTGKSFRCVEYGVVSAAALNSIGLPARVIGLKTRDVEKVKYGAGHVAAEVFLADFNKWVFIDGQFNAIPVLNNVPLNAVEFKRAIIDNRNDLQIVSLNGVATEKQKDNYLKFAAKYLFYFDVTFDQRVGEDIKYEKVNGKTKLTLVPVNAKNPSVFQKKYPINYTLYTNSIGDFYQKPKI